MYTCIYIWMCITWGDVCIDMWKRERKNGAHALTCGCDTRTNTDTYAHARTHTYTPARPHGCDTHTGRQEEQMLWPHAKYKVDNYIHNMRLTNTMHTYAHFISIQQTGPLTGFLGVKLTYIHYMKLIQMLFIHYLKPYRTVHRLLLCFGWQIYLLHDID